MFDLHNNIQLLNHEVGTLSNDTAVTIKADRAGYDAIEMFWIAGALGDANMTFTVLVEDSDDNSTFAAVADDFLLGLEVPTGETLNFADDNKSIKIGYAGNKRYVQFTVTPAGNTDASPYALAMLGGKPIRAPKTTQTVTAS